RCRARMEIDVNQIATRILRKTLAAIDIPATLERKLDLHGSRVRVGAAEIDLREFKELVAIAYGKAAFAMAGGLTAVLAPDFSTEGILVVPAAPPRQLPGWT